MNNEFDKLCNFTVQELVDLFKSLNPENDIVITELHGKSYDITVETEKHIRLGVHRVGDWLDIENTIVALLVEKLDVNRLDIRSILAVVIDLVGASNLLRKYPKHLHAICVRIHVPDKLPNVCNVLPSIECVSLAIDLEKEHTQLLEYLCSDIQSMYLEVFHKHGHEHLSKNSLDMFRRINIGERVKTRVTVYATGYVPLNIDTRTCTEEYSKELLKSVEEVGIDMDI